jgi:hypothetical protein
MLAGCGGPSGDTWPSPEKQQISSALRRNSDEVVVIALTSSGGGAGDITYRVLACKSGMAKCELLASIDTNDRAPPTLSRIPQGITLTVNKSDYIADFRNFSRELGTIRPGELYLLYRDNNQ